MIKKIRHLGIVVEDVETAVKKYEGFGLTCSERFEKEEDGMEFAFFPVGDTLIEFLSFSPDKGWDPFHTLVRTHKDAINHICFEVANLDESIEAFKKNGAVLSEGSPRAGAHGRVAFFTPESTDGVLIEICEV